jgi:multicomponent Na+:H+ antiporter subunit C
VLTAIVIGFALLCFSLVLALRLIEHGGTDDALELRQAEPHPADPVKPPLPEPRFAPIADESGAPRAAQEAVR